MCGARRVLRITISEASVDIFTSRMAHGILFLRRPAQVGRGLRRRTIFSRLEGAVVHRQKSITRQMEACLGLRRIRLRMARRMLFGVFRSNESMWPVVE